MNALATAVCELMGWADGESLRSRIARVAPQVAESLGLSAGHGVDPRFVREVAERCAVNETYFLRHPQQLAATCAETQRAFPQQKLVIWSAACSSGEEPYSLSMLLIDAGLPAERFEVLGTDGCESVLTHARAARYAEWSFRGVPRVVRERCFFTAERGTGGDVFELHQRYRGPVRFASHNLLVSPPLRQAHLISCRNALIYLHPAAVRVALCHFDSALAPGGFLLLGAAEQHLAGVLGFEAVVSDGMVLLRKPGPGTKTVGAASAARPTPPPAESVAGPSPVSPRSSLEAAWCALRAGVEREARVLAQGAAAAQDAEAHLLLATLDDAAGDSANALEHLRRALYLDPGLIVAHVAQAALYQRLGRGRDAARARSNALRQLRGLAPETVLSGLTPVTARELRHALEAP